MAKAGQKWDMTGMPEDGQVVNLDLTIKKQETSYTDTATGLTSKTLHLVNISEGSGKFKHGTTIATLPNGDRVTLQVHLKIIPALANKPTTISSSKFSINK